MSGKELARIAAGHPAVKLALLFGSVGAGTARSHSDIDVAVAGERALSAEARGRLIEELALAFGRPVDLVDLQTAGAFLLREVLTKGKLQYCKDRRLYAELIKRMVFEQADFLPYRERMLRERRRAWIGD
jgi:uncharacterized protein